MKIEQENLIIEVKSISILIAFINSLICMKRFFYIIFKYNNSVQYLKLINYLNYFIKISQILSINFS